MLLTGCTTASGPALRRSSLANGETCHAYGAHGSPAHLHFEAELPQRKALTNASALWICHLYLMPAELAMQ